MVLFPNCKVNLGLHILRKRNDGFHDLETVFYPLPFREALEVVEAGGEENIQFSASGITIQGNNEDNLCVKAFQLLKKDIPGLPAIKMHLHKTIPPGAGLGGGSADGVFTLKILNQKFNLGLSTEKMLDYALQLGSDCPFFVINTPCFAGGRGEILETIEPGLSTFKFVIINPGIHISTAEAFSLLTPAPAVHSIKKIIHQPVNTWKEELKNDFEEPVFNKYPEIKSIKDKLYTAGALYASMTGSGSTVYGIFEKNMNLTFDFPKNYFVKELISQA